MKQARDIAQSLPHRNPTGSASTPGRAGLLAIGYLVLAVALPLVSCSGDDTWHAEEWSVDVTSTADHVIITATVAGVCNDFIHLSIRKEGHDNGYTVDRSPAPNQPERDWSRVHHWFGELHPNTYLEGRIDDGSGRGPSSFQTFVFHLPRGVTLARDNFPDEHGSDYEYITRGYSYADGNSQHPRFDEGAYEIEVYAWYTGKANDTHPSIDDSPGVQYIHYEQHLTSSTFTLD